MRPLPRSKKRINRVLRTTWQPGDAAEAIYWLLLVAARHPSIRIVRSKGRYYGQTEAQNRLMARWKQLHPESILLRTGTRTAKTNSDTKR